MHAIWHAVVYKREYMCEHLLYSAWLLAYRALYVIVAHPIVYLSHMKFFMPRPVITRHR